MEFKRIGSTREPVFAEAFELYKNSFPEYEQRPAEKQTALMANPLYHFDIIMNDNIFAGILLYWEISFYTYIEHFAIHPAVRGKALGSASLAAFCGNRSFVILEIDPPCNEISIRRECFYQRLGFKRNGFEHKHPAYRKEFLPHELLVMSYPGRMTPKEYRLFKKELDEIVMKDADA